MSLGIVSSTKHDTQPVTTHNHGFNICKLVVRGHEHHIMRDSDELKTNTSEITQLKSRSAIHKLLRQTSWT